VMRPTQTQGAHGAPLRRGHHVAVEPSARWATRALTRYGPRPLTDRFPSEHDQAHPLQGSEINL
jgi:hypothetical protein